MPDQVRHDGFGTFYEFIKIDSPVKSQKSDGKEKSSGSKRVNH